MLLALFVACGQITSELLKKLFEFRKLTREDFTTTEDDQEVCAHTIYCTNIGKKVKWNPNFGVIHSSYHVGSASWEWNIFP
ncbi:unnamed protein product [Sphagnum jensenii]|uniref:Uncharacterized protein n=1 Tax=Sphagnum jensenii TaxID=128206 RepID=A0ABP1B099_9BRYO